MHTHASPSLVAFPSRTSTSAQATRTAPQSSPSRLAYPYCLIAVLRLGALWSSITGIAPSPIVVSPSMESCVLPIELCEKVMDAIPEYVEFRDESGWPTWPEKPWDSQQALWACALTCRAWRVRAQYLLWTLPCLIQSRQFLRFNTAIRKSLNTPTISGLALGTLGALRETSDLSTAGELFMHSFPHLRSLNLCTAAENLRACRKLTRLWLYSATTEKYWIPSDNIGISSVGRVFGDAVTELFFITAHRPDVFICLFRESFPALRSVTVWFEWLDENPEFPSWLHIIATGRPIPGILKTIVLRSSHDRRGHNCCRKAVGTSEEVVGSSQRLPELLPELAELVLRLYCNHPARHAAYIWDVLPGFRNVLRFRYHADDDEDWRPYAVLPQDVPRLLAQDTDSDSDSDSSSYLDDNCHNIPLTHSAPALTT
ncbi:hypothetical protein VTO73DRAFT_12972 [Trametes versicolor]